MPAGGCSGRGSSLDSSGAIENGFFNAVFAYSILTAGGLPRQARDRHRVNSYFGQRSVFSRSEPLAEVNQLSLALSLTAPHTCYRRSKKQSLIHCKTRSAPLGIQRIRCAMIIDYHICYVIGHFIGHFIGARLRLL